MSPRRAGLRGAQAPLPPRVGASTVAAACLLGPLVAACPRDPPPPLHVQLGGCAEWRAGDVCVLGAEPLVVWVA
jgi:hypothetical protein